MFFGETGAVAAEQRARPRSYVAREADRQVARLKGLLPKGEVAVIEEQQAASLELSIEHCEFLLEPGKGKPREQDAGLPVLSALEDGKGEDRVEAGGCGKEG